MANSFEPLAVIGNYETVLLALSGNPKDVVYTVPAAYLAIFVTQIRCIDSGGAARTVDLYATKGATDFVLIKAGAIPVNASLDLSFNPLVLKTDDVIKATGSAASVQVMVSFAAQARKHT